MSPRIDADTRQNVSFKYERQFTDRSGRPFFLFPSIVSEKATLRRSLLLSILSILHKHCSLFIRTSGSIAVMDNSLFFVLLQPPPHMGNCCLIGLFEFVEKNSTSKTNNNKFQRQMKEVKHLLSKHYVQMMDSNRRTMGNCRLVGLFEFLGKILNMKKPKFQT